MSDAYSPTGGAQSSLNPAPRLPVVWVGAILTLFTIGGLLFGLVFLRNVRILSARGMTVRTAIQRELPRQILPANAPLASLPAAISSSVSTTVRQQVGELPHSVASSVSSAQSTVSTAASTAASSAGSTVSQSVPQVLPAWTGTQRINILLLGVDQRPDEPVEGTRSDTVIVLSIDPVQHSAVMASFPRDLWVPIPGYGEQRLNVAHSVGGPELTERTLEANFGIHSDYWARVNFSGFRKTVDEMGGVIIDVERPIKDDEYPTEDYGYQRVYIGAGPQLMDGETALEYARSRHSENDFGRARRQQRTLVAMRDRAMQLSMLPKVPTLLGDINTTVSTDMGPAQIVGMARLAMDLDSNKVSSVVFDARYAEPFIGEGGANLLRPDSGAIRQVVARIEAGYEPEPATVEWLNGTSTQGLAAKAADIAGKHGYLLYRLAPADTQDQAHTEIVATGERHTSAVALAQMLGLPADTVRDAPAEQGGPDIRVIVGNDFKPPIG